MAEMGYINDYQTCEGCFYECPLDGQYKTCGNWKECKKDNEML